MQKLIRGERQATFGVLLGLVALLAIGAGLILFVLDTRQTARESQRVARAAVESEQQLRDTILMRCKQRLAYDERFVKTTEGDLEFYETLDEISKLAPIPPGTPPEVVALYRRQQQAIAKQRAAKKAILAQGVIGNCEQYQTSATSTTTPEALS